MSTAGPAARVWIDDAEVPVILRVLVLEDRVLEFGLTLGPSASRCQSAYRRVNLRALSAERLLSEASPVLWPLVPLTGDGATIQVALLRIKAKDPRDRLGTIFVNPGGPGDSARDFAFSAQVPMDRPMRST